MTSPLRSLLAEYRASARTEREKGNYFERLAVAFMKHDPGMAQEYDDAWLYSDWAAANGLDRNDDGIDVVARVRSDGTFCAIQCKFYREGHRIRKEDIDSFFTASGRKQFSRRLIIDTTDAPWSDNAEASLVDQDKPISRIGVDRLEESPIDWSAFLLRDEVKLAAPKQIRPHQKEALTDVRKGLAEADRGKLVMACGTGKTFTGLKIAEDLVGIGGMVLFLVPSLALMSQTIREWTIDAAVPLRAFAVCSDSQVGKRRKNQNTDVAEIETHDLDYPATTDAKKLAGEMSRPAGDRMTVVFATYQSIQTISDAQHRHGLPEFDLIVCDEAHRTTGAKEAGDDESHFVRVHDQSFIKGRKRLYMTATPKVFAESAKAKASEISTVVFSMDDEDLYGKTLFARGFGWAVENELLTDYKVLVLAVDEHMISGGVQKRLADGTSELKLDDASKIIGCYKALTKHGLREELVTDPQPMKRALAFCKDIASSKLIQGEFADVVTEYLASDEGREVEGDAQPLDCQLKHVDGTFNAKERNRLLDWIKADDGENTCRILTNAKCLSEGVDVPALDAILFMHPRKSQIDVVQSVGRVMRRAPGKNMGYVILPIGVPAGMTPEEALNDNERYRVVWQILNALRSHDERFDSMINKAELGVDISDHIEVIAVSNRLPAAKQASAGRSDIGHGAAPDDDVERDDGRASKPVSPTQGVFFFDEFSKAIMAKIVKKCGRRDYWDKWATDIARIAQTHITRIGALVDKPGTSEKEAFDRFLAEIRDDLNDSISPAEAVEMLAQHVITRPVFEALFEGYSFTEANPVSQAMQAVLDALDEHNLDKESESLQKFYDSVRRRAAGIDNADAKQKIIVELYDKFFRNAFPKMTERLGIVYTPIEVVDFIIHSVNDVLKKEFDQTLGSRGVHILDPFTGTGTFITRLLQSGLIRPEELAHKYANEIHANEIVLLAYYIAAINIEAVYHSLSGGEYKPFEGICLTDTFQLYEQDRDLISDLLVENSNRRTRQKALDIRIVMGNPPYSVGQGSANDNAANVSYPKLDNRIREAYAEGSRVSSVRNLYDSYIRAIRWASDRIGDSGVVAFVTNASWIDSNATDGMRKAIAGEFSNVHVFHLRGNQRTSGERSRREGGKIFGSGSRTPVAIMLLTKNPKSSSRGQIFYHDIGDYLSQQEKLDIVRSFGSIEGIEAADGWSTISPDEHGDWVSQRDAGFGEFIPLGNKKTDDPAIFENFSLGVATGRDAWCYNGSPKAVADNMRRMVSFYGSEQVRLADQHPDLDRKARGALVDGFVDNSPTKISWTRALKQDLAKNKSITFDEANVSRSLYRPFMRQWLYFSRSLNEMVYQIPRMFPTGDEANLAICVSNGGEKVGFSALLTDSIPSLHLVDIEGSQCFPRYLYASADEDADDGQSSLFAKSSPLDAGFQRRDGLTDEGLAHFQNAFPGEMITKDDLFYYVYGILHSPDYRERYSDNLSKELPRIPAASSIGAFRAFSEAGRRLGVLHTQFETVDPYPVIFTRGDTSLAPPADPVSFYRVDDMKFAGKRPNLDKSTVVYNGNITISGIPLEAYDYVVNGKPALEWVMERQCVKTDKASGIVNDSNRYANETVGDPAYPLLLFQRIITVSLETMKIVRSLPALDLAAVHQIEAQAAE